MYSNILYVTYTICVVVRISTTCGYVIANQYDSDWLTKYRIQEKNCENISVDLRIDHQFCFLKKNHHTTPRQMQVEWVGY